MTQVNPNTLPTNQAAFDLFSTTPIIFAGRYAVKIINPVTTPSEKTWSSIKARLLCLVQAIVCLVVLPFKFLFSIALGIYTLFSPNFQENAPRAAYSLLSVGLHAMAIPTAVVLACMPSRIISQAAEMTNTFTQGRDLNQAVNEFRQNAAEALRRGVVGLQ